MWSQSMGGASRGVMPVDEWQWSVGDASQWMVPLVGFG